MIFLTEFSSNTNPNDVSSISKFLWRSLDQKHFDSLESETSVLKFFRCSVDGRLSMFPRIGKKTCFQREQFFKVLVYVGSVVYSSVQ